MQFWCAGIEELFWQIFLDLEQPVQFWICHQIFSKLSGSSIGLMDNLGSYSLNSRNTKNEAFYVSLAENLTYQIKVFTWLIHLDFCFKVKLPS